MQRLPILTVALAAFSLTALNTALHAQADPDQNAPAIQNQAPAPIERSAPDYNQPMYAAPGRNAPGINILSSQPTPGITVRSEQNVETITATATQTELRVEHGRANITVHQPARNSEILVDLPGGQTTLLKDGLYTFNADTNTVRVLKGEAETLPPNAKPIKIKEDHQLTFNGAELRSMDVGPWQARADLLENNRNGDGPPRPSYGSYGYYGPYGYPYPYYAYGYPYGYYPFGLGLGFGYYGGFRGGFGGFRGGYGGFRR